MRGSGPTDDDEDEESLGIYDGERFVFTQNSAKGRLQYWWNTVKILWKYGISLYKTIQMMKSTVSSFLMLYDEPFFPWKHGLTNAAGAVGLLNTTSSTGLEFLRAGGVTDRFANDIVQASTRVNYAQNIDTIHGLEAMVCKSCPFGGNSLWSSSRHVSGACWSFQRKFTDNLRVGMATEGAMAVDGGNWQIFAAMLNASGADVYLNSKVDEIEIGDPDAGLRILSEDLSTVEYGLDALVLAAPYYQAGIKFTPTPDHVPEDIPYVDLHVTLLSSPHRLSPKAFGLTEHEQVPDVVLTTLPPGRGSPANGAGPAGFFSISLVRAAQNPHVVPPRKEYIYKIFSPEAVSATFLKRILGLHGSTNDEADTTLEKKLDPNDISWIYRKLWQSYPYLPPRHNFEPSQLDTNLWYTSGIESFISTMETSALSGKNVARLIVDGWLADAR